MTLTKTLLTATVVLALQTSGATAQTTTAPPPPGPFQPSAVPRQQRPNPAWLNALPVPYWMQNRAAPSGANPQVNQPNSVQTQRPVFPQRGQVPTGGQQRQNAPAWGWGPFGYAPQGQYPQGNPNYYSVPGQFYGPRPPFFPNGPWGGFNGPSGPIYGYQAPRFRAPAWSSQ